MQSLAVTMEAKKVTGIFLAYFVTRAGACGLGQACQMPSVMNSEKQGWGVTAALALHGSGSSDSNASVRADGGGISIFRGLRGRCALDSCSACIDSPCFPHFPSLVLPAS